MQTMLNPSIPRVIKRKEGRAILNPEYKTLYHRRMFAAATAQTLVFFRDFVATTAIDTNMSISGMLASPHEFSLYGISCFIDQGTINTDWHILLNQTVLFFRLSEKDKLQEPLHMIPSSGGLHGFSSGAVAAITEMGNGVPMPLNYFPLSVYGKPVHISSNQVFQVTLQSFNAVAFTGTPFAFVHLHGVQYTPIQG